MSDLGALVPGPSEEKGILVVQDAKFLEPAGDQIPTVKIGGRVGAGFEKPPPHIATALKAAGAVLENGQSQQQHGENGREGEPAQRPPWHSVSVLAPGVAQHREE